MNLRTLALSAAIASIMLAACGKPAEPAPAAEPAVAPATEAMPAPEEAPAADPAAATEAATDADATANAPAEPAPAEPAAAETPAPAEAAPAATAAAASCAIDIEANDMMKFNVSSIVVPSSCTTFTINLKHVGKMPVAAMGHNVVIAKKSDAAGILADGASVRPEHLKEGDARVIAHTRMLGGGESASVTFDVAKIRDGGPYEFFCSFPAHYVLMKGPISVQ